MNSQEVSSKTPDWSREALSRHAFEPSKRLLKSIRKYQYFRNHRLPLLRPISKLHVLSHRFWSVICGCDIPLNTAIEGGLILPHPNGVVIHPEVRIGPNCLIMQQVTVGFSERTQGVPVIEGHVDIGAGAKIIGKVTLGEHCKIGANAVVLCDVPPHATAVGVPARILPGK